MAYFRGQLVEAESAKALLEKVPTEAQLEAAGISFDQTGMKMSIGFLDWAKYVSQHEGKLYRGQRRGRTARRKTRNSRPATSTHHGRYAGFGLTC